MDYFNTTAIVIHSMGNILVLIIVTSTIFSYYKKIETLKIAMISVSFFVLLPQLKRQEFLNQEVPEGMIKDENSGYSKVYRVLQPSQKLCFIVINNYLLNEAIEGNFMLIVVSSFQLALISIYFDNLPTEEAISLECLKWLFMWMLIMLPLQYFGLKHLYKKFAELNFEANA